MAIVRPDNCHPFRTAFYINQGDEHGRIAYLLGGTWFAVPYAGEPRKWPHWQDAAFAVIVVLGTLFLATVPL